MPETNLIFFGAIAAITIIFGVTLIAFTRTDKSFKHTHDYNQSNETWKPTSPKGEQSQNTQHEWLDENVPWNKRGFD